MKPGAEQIEVQLNGKSQELAVSLVELAEKAHCSQ